MTATTSSIKLAPVEVPLPPKGGWALMYGGAAHEPINGQQILVESAIDGSVIASIPNADRADLDQAVSAAWTAAAVWGKKSPAYRAAALEEFAAELQRANERLGWLDTINAGMPITSTRKEALDQTRALAHNARQGSLIKGSTFPAVDRVWGYTTREPYGVVANIQPFNHPTGAVLHGIALALAAGNAVVIKPSEWVSLSALEIGAIAQDVLPPGLVSVLTGDGLGIGAAICEHPRIPRISFTGSVNTGRAVLRVSAEYIKHVTLELGGKGPLAILPDVDIDLAVEMAVGGMNFLGVQAGQSCSSTSRVLVHESMYAEFAERMVAAVEQIQIGDPRDPLTNMGALAYRKHFERVRDYIKVGIDGGAELLSGGGVPSGFEAGLFLEPTVFGRVDRSMRIANEEIFGPVVALMPWSTEAELIEISNGVQYGLSARIACGDLGPGLRLAGEIEAGRMWINVASGGPTGMPMGGYKLSGLGKDYDFDSLVSYTREKSITVAL